MFVCVHPALHRAASLPLCCSFCIASISGYTDEWVEYMNVPTQNPSLLSEDRAACLATINFSHSHVHSDDYGRYWRQRRGCWAKPALHRATIIAAETTMAEETTAIVMFTLWPSAQPSKGPRHCHGAHEHQSHPSKRQRQSQHRRHTRHKLQILVAAMRSVPSVHRRPAPQVLHLRMSR